MDTHRKARTVYQFKVTLLEIRPAVWRRIQVPSTYSFWGLHVAIQDSMGWLDGHLHEFQIADLRTGQLARIGIPDQDAFEGDKLVLPGWNVPISAYFSLENRSALYNYDFGDDWNHAVKLEDIVPGSPGVRYPVCTAGARRCPPEDVGGPHGYREFLHAIRNPRHEEHHEYLEWVGGPFDPRSFEPAQVWFDSPTKRWKNAFERHL